MSIPHKMAKPLKVLIVENSEDDVVLMVTYLQRNGYDVGWRVVETATDFSAALISEPWELILSDYTMPSFTGLEALRICRSLGSDIPFILVSGSIGEERAVEALHSGADDYIMKDRMQRLSSAVERALREATIRRESLRAKAEILRLNGELRDKVVLLSRSNAELDQFASAASHDLKEPLRTVIMYTRLLLRRSISKFDADEIEFAGYIQSAVETMRALIDGVLTYSRVTHKLEGSIASADPATAVSHALIALRGALDESKAIVGVDVLPTVAMEPVRLTQVFQNLIGNALKYRQPDQPPRIDVSAEEHDGEVHFTVRDNGIGISPEHYERVFVLFRRLHGVEYPGIGLGLAVCKRIVEGCGGRIWLESELGAGSTFHFTIPAEAKAAAATAHEGL
jgi:signal transduction histidine kinase